MFSSKKQLQKRTPQNGTDRENFLSLLVDEYLNTSGYDAKCQVLANLANFAYDPINYGFIRDVGVLDVFLYVIKNESDSKLLHFASAGVCNLCIDPVNAEYILEHCGLTPIVKLLNQENKEVVANSISTLLYLCNKNTKLEIAKPEVITIIENYSISTDIILKNLATILLGVIKV